MEILMSASNDLLRQRLHNRIRECFRCLRNGGHHQCETNHKGSNGLRLAVSVGVILIGRPHCDSEPKIDHQTGYDFGRRLQAVCDQGK